MLLQGSSCRQVTHRRVVCDNVFLTPRCSSESPIRSNHGEMLVSIPQTIKKSRKCTLNTQKRPFQLVNKISCWLLCNDALEHSFAEKKVWKERTRCQLFFSHCLSSPFVFFQLLNIKPLFTFPPLFQKQVCLYIQNNLQHFGKTPWKHGHLFTSLHHHHRTCFPPLLLHLLQHVQGFWPL